MDNKQLPEWVKNSWLKEAASGGQYQELWWIDQDFQKGWHTMYCFALCI